jgi:hypothetical protein
MGPPAPGFRLVWDVVPFDARWVLLPGAFALGLALGLLLLRQGVQPERQRPRRLLGGGALLLFLAFVWWTLGGVGAWRAGAGRLLNGTANYAEGTLEACALDRDGAVVSFQVGGQPLHRAWDAAFPPLHATRWPTVPLQPGQKVRVWFFGDDVLRLEVSGPP